MESENNVAAQAGRNKSVHSRSGLPNYGCSASNSIKGWHERNSSGVCALCGDGPIAAQAGDEPTWMTSDLSFVLAHLKENTIFDTARIQREWDEMKALAIRAQVSPRAPADVEQLVLDLSKWTGEGGMTMANDFVGRAKAILATTKPGA